MTQKHREWGYRLFFLIVTFVVLSYFEGQKQDYEGYVPLVKTILLWLYAEVFHRGLMHKGHREHHHKG